MLSCSGEGRQTEIQDDDDNDDDDNDHDHFPENQNHIENYPRHPIKLNQ